MDKKYVIFDMDGTLVDSMSYWRRLAHEFLNSKGVKEIPDNLRERIKPITMLESATIFVEEFGLKEEPQQLVDEMNEMMNNHYRTDVPLKTGVLDYIKKLSQEGVRMCVASATELALMEECLTRLGIRDYFEFLISCETIGVGKTEPDIYLECAKRFGAEPSEIAVFEDAIYAIKTARKAGFLAIGVKDVQDGEHWQRVVEEAHQVVIDYKF